MKHQISPRPLRAMTALAVLALFAMTVVAQDSTTSKSTPAAGATSTAAPAPASQAAPQLSYGVPEVLKLSDAKINEDTIIAYIQNSGKSYGGLNASEIVYLHEQGVSDRVVATMLNQRKQLTEAAAQTTTQPATSAAYAGANTGQSSQVYVQPPVTYVQPAPVSSVYVIPNSPSYVDYGYYPSYGYYGYGYSYPAVSLSFGFGSYYGRGYYGGGYRGGYYGGGYRGGGGYHGGGSFGGGSHGGGGHHR
jgi:hypothetical protein